MVKTHVLGPGELGSSVCACVCVCGGEETGVRQDFQHSIFSSSSLKQGVGNKRTEKLRGREAVKDHHRLKITRVL